MKFLYTIAICGSLFLTTNIHSQNNDGFLNRLKKTSSSEIKIGNYTFKDGSVYTGELKSRKPNGKGNGLILKIISHWHI